MTPFEYVTVLISIILGLGITQIVTGIADMVHQYERIKIYWPHALWIVLVFVMHIHEWWVTYDLKQYHSWRLPTFLFVILYPINLFILARILFPFGSVAERVDYRDFYFENYRKFFLWIMILALLSLIHNVFIENYPIQTQAVHLAILLTLGLIVIKKYTFEWLHRLIVIALIAILIGSIIVTWNDLMIS